MSNIKRDIKDLSCSPRRAKYIIVFNDEEYFAENYLKAEGIYNIFNRKKSNADYLKMFIYKKMPSDSHIE
ncbi:MAG: hypothetical protein ACOCP8_05160 [archaeon]